MKLLKKEINYFTGQSDKFIGWKAIKCILLEKDSVLDDMHFKIKKDHLVPLPKIADYDTAVGELSFDSNNKFDTVFLSIIFKEDGMVFEAGYCINIANGEVEFQIDMPLISTEDFVLPADMDTDLTALIRNALKTNEEWITIEDQKFYKYFSDNYMNTFINYVGYLEGLVSVDKCKECVYAYKYILSGSCKDHFKKNRFSSKK